MIPVAVAFLTVFFVVGSITPLLLGDDTDGIVERRRHADDEPAPQGGAAPRGRGKLALSRPAQRSRMPVHRPASRRLSAARSAWLQRRAG